MPDAPVPPKRRLRAPSARRFAAGALACFVAVFGVLALRVHDGVDPALTRAAKAKAKAASTPSTSSSSSSESDPYDSWDSGTDDSGPSDDPGVTATPGASTSAS